MNVPSSQNVVEVRKWARTERREPPPVREPEPFPVKHEVDREGWADQRGKAVERKSGDDALFSGPSVLDEETAARAESLRGQPRSPLPAPPAPIRES